jgi:DNA-binding beta-propeller fold protein YncE
VTPAARSAACHKCLYVTVDGAPNGGTVAILPKSLNGVTTVQGTFNNPSGVAFAPNGLTAYVADTGFNYQGNTVSVTNVAHPQVSATVNLPPGVGGPVDLVVSPSGGEVYVTTAQGVLVGINTTNDTATSLINFGQTNLNGIVISGTTLYVANTDRSTVDAVNTTNDAVTPISLAPGQPISLALSSTGILYASTNFGSGNTQLAEINTSTDHVTYVPLGGGGGGSYQDAAVTSNGKYVYVAGSGASPADTTAVVKTSNNQVTPLICPGPLNPNEFNSPDAIVANGGGAYVTNYQPGPDPVVKMSHNKCFDTPAAGGTNDSFPAGIAIQP